MVELEEQPGVKKQQTPWETALSRAKTELGPSLYAVVSEIGDYESCRVALQSKSKQMSSQWPEAQNTVSKFLDLLNTFDKAISMCCQSNPNISCLIWGSFHAVMATAGKYRECAGSVEKMMFHITNSMPRFEDYLNYFPEDTRLQALLVEIYRTFVVFCAKAYRIFSSPRIVGPLRATWSDVDEQLRSEIEALEVLKREMDAEAQAAHISISAKRHNDVMDKLDEHNNGQRPQPSVCYRELPRAIVTAPRHIEAFTGRAQELEKLAQLLGGERVTRTEGGSGREQNPACAHTTVPPVISICGSAGMGKTTLALECIHQNTASYRARFWIRAEIRAVIQQDLAAIGQRIATELNAKPATDLSKAAKDAVEWMETTPEKWLLVFDNVDDPSYVREYLPATGRGSVIITTRDRGTAYDLGERSKTIELQGMDMATGMQMLHNLIPTIAGESPKEREENDRAIHDLLDKIGGMPLFIQHMGKYMAETRRTPCELNAMFESIAKRLYQDKTLTSSQYPWTVAICCAISTDHLSAEDRYLYGIIALFQTDKVQYGLLRTGCSDVARLRYLADEYSWDKSVRCFNKYFLASLLRDEKGSSFCIHRLYKLHATHMLSDAGDLEAALADASTLLHAVFPKRPKDGGTMTKQWSECELWLPHVLSLKSSFLALNKDNASVTFPRAYAEILCNCAWYMWERSTKGAFKFAEDALDVCRDALGYTEHRSNHDRDDSHARSRYDTLVSDMYTVVGAVRMERHQHRFDACNAFEEALYILTRITEARTARHESRPFPEDELLANAYNNAGAGYKILKEWDKAQAVFDQAYALKKKLGNEITMPYNFAIARYNQSRLNLERGQAEKARDDGRRALELIQSCEGAEGHRTLQFSFTYAEILIAVGQVAEGLALHQQTLNTRLRVMGDDNIDTAMSYYGLGCVYHKLRDFEHALSSIKNAIGIFEMEEKPEAQLARAHFREKLIYDDWGQHEDKAEAAHAQAREYRQKLLSDEHGTGTFGDTMADYDALVSYNR